MTTMRTSMKTMTSTKRTRTTKTTKMRIRSRTAALFVVIANVIATGGVLVAQNGAQDAAHAVVAGTVFRENGLSLAGATVTLMAKDTGDNAAKRKPLRY